jgi:flagellar motility protein MotE (MotC chaperone)
MQNLVRIYESMKPPEAARIFSNLDMPVLLQVVRQMKPARSAAILAEMPPERAKEVTTALSQKFELPGGEALATSP